MGKIIRIEKLSQGTSIIIVSTASSKEKPLLPYKSRDQKKKKGVFLCRCCSDQMQKASLGTSNLHKYGICKVP